MLYEDVANSSYGVVNEILRVACPRDESGARDKECLVDCLNCREQREVVLLPGSVIVSMIYFS